MKSRDATRASAIHVGSARMGREINRSGFTGTQKGSREMWLIRCPCGWVFKGTEETRNPPRGVRRLHDTQPPTVVPWLIYSLLAVGKLRPQSQDLVEPSQHILMDSLREPALPRPNGSGPDEAGMN